MTRTVSSDSETGIIIIDYTESVETMKTYMIERGDCWFFATSLV